jgi:hypothetical protein
MLQLNVWHSYSQMSRDIFYKHVEFGLKGFSCWSTISTEFIQLLVGREEESDNEEHPPDKGHRPHLGNGGGGEATTGRGRGGPSATAMGTWPVPVELSRMVGSRRSGLDPFGSAFCWI